MKESIFLDTTTANTLGIGLFRYTLIPQEKFVASNTALTEIFEFPSQKEFEQCQFRNLLIHSEAQEKFFHKLDEDRRIKFFEAAARTQNGKTVWVSISACLVADGNGEKYIEGIVEDITQFRKTTERVAQEIDLLQNFLDSMPDAIYFKDCKNRITRVNKFYANGFKMKPEQILGKTDFDFFPQDQAQKMFDDDNYILKTGEPIVGKIERTLLPNGTWNQVITTKVPMYDRDGKIIGTMGITRDMTAHANLEKERFSMLLNALTVLSKALEMRDPYTYCHTRYVAKIAQAIGKALNFNENKMMQIKLAAELHDLGKISIPLDILIKPGRLSEVEYRLVQTHVENCHSLIKDIKFPFPLAEIIYQHHERLDGSGYPRQLKEEQILYEARILAVSDVLEAMTSHRPYREALGIVKALEELKKGQGIKYDVKIVDTVVDLIKDNGGKPFWQNSN